MGEGQCRKDGTQDTRRDPLSGSEQLNHETTLDALVPLMREEIDRGEYGEVSLTVNLHHGRIVRWNITRSYTSKLVRVPDGGVDNQPP